MAPHAYLEQGLSVLHARLRTPLQPTPGGVQAEVRPFITISRETGAGATTLGCNLVPMLNEQSRAEGHEWVFLDRDLLTHALTQHQLPLRLAEFLPEDRVSEIRAAIGELVGLHPSLWQLEQKITEAVLQLAHVGYVIFAGRAAHVITHKLAGGLHVRLVASLETRIPRVAQELHCSEEAALLHIGRQDQARRRFVRSNFAKEIEDPHLYDLVINTDDWAPATTARLVMTALRDRIDDARAQLREQALTASAAG